jgi:hypothetical protein
VAHRLVLAECNIYREFLNQRLGECYALYGFEDNHTHGTDIDYFWGLWRGFTKSCGFRGA